MSEDESPDEAWVRDLLTSLPRPRIPGEVADRLDAAITAAPLLPQQRQPEETPAPARRRGRTFLAGAGLVAGAALSVLLLDPLGGAAAPPPAQPASIAGGGELTEVLMSSATSYTQAQWAQQAVAVAGTRPPGLRSDLPPMWAEAASMPAARAEGAAACIAGLANQRGTLILVDRAAYEGRPALVVVRRDGGMLEVHVLHPRCTGAESAVVAHARVRAPSGGE